MGVREQVRFVRFSPTAAQLLPGYRVYVHGALIENFPFVVLEALACGLPVLAPPTGGMPEAFTSGVEGYLWPLDDPNAGARKLITVLEDEATYARLSRNARDRFRITYVTEKIAPKLKKFLLDL